MRCGIGISSGRVHAVLASRGHIVWTAARDVDAPEQLEAGIDHLLAALPRRRWRRAKAIAAIGPMFVQTKSLAGLPAVTHTDDLTQIIRTNMHRFFLTNGLPTVTSRVRIEPDGSVWAAAFERPVVDAVARVCRARRVKLEAVVPTMAVLGCALQDTSFTWRDGAAAFYLSFADTRLIEVRRITVEWTSRCAAPKPVSRLAVVGADAWRLADAYGAAVVDPRTALRLVPGREPDRKRALPMWRAVVAVAVLLFAACVFIAGPGIGEYLAGKQAESWLARHRAVQVEALKAQASLERVTSALNAIARFEQQRSLVLFLRDLSQAVPKASALLALRVDSLEGTMVLLSKPGRSTYEWLEQLSGVSEPAIVGPVTRERIGEQTLERMTVRFTFTEHGRGPKQQGAT